MKEIALYNNNLNFENINKNESIILSEENFENKLNATNKSNNYKMKSSISFHTASSTASMKSIKKKKKKLNCNENKNNNTDEKLNKNDVNLLRFNDMEKRNLFDENNLSCDNKMTLKCRSLSNNKVVLKKLEYEDNNFNFIFKKTKSFNFQNSLKKKIKNNKNKIIINRLKTIQSEILDFKVDNNIYNEKKEKNIVIDSLITSDENEMKKEGILLQYEKYKHKKKRKKKIKSRLFKKSVCYSNYISPDIINLLNQTKLNLTFYQREADDFLNVIRNLQNIVLIEREKYNELKEMLKYTTEEIEKENNKLYEELNIYKQKYYKLKKLISNIGYGIFFNIDKKEMNYKYNNKDNAYINFEKLYISEDNENQSENEYDYIMVNKKLNFAKDKHDNNKCIKKSKNSNHSSLLNYLDF
ncbi:conserved Plasmodium protein, unknown function [Plasmodium gallinaceum]|uniref:Uncharacterized protein n=1 Tax=Plasmodium gallinaceum TaxID=5849 RepID=A0A1J1GMI1_PLAGA|nr:conserved Plasmodium protein, unknown function [Plasmodium gallinaceum]CRG93609.1 conserved Plasmodium protein, unknown function [Plasmodium gallinaceum]